MGDRASVSFSCNGKESIILNSHWGGREFQDAAAEHGKRLVERAAKKKGVMPIDRLEPDVVMVDFIRELTKDMDIVDGDYRVARSVDEVDNSDHGHLTVDLGKMRNDLRR